MARPALVSAALCLLSACLLAAPALARPGEVDGTFGVGGQAMFPNRGEYGDPRGLARHPDGKLVVGLTGGLVRFDPDGALDRTFGSGGVATTGLSFAPGRPVARADGRVVVAGRRTTGQNADTAAVVRLLPNGQRDPEFGSGGTATIPGGGESSEAWGAFEQSDGRLVVLARATDPPTESSPYGELRARVARLMPDGTLDRSFGKDGWATLDVPDSIGLIYFGLEHGGKLVVGGEFNRRSTPEPDFEATIFRLHPDGTPDRSFGTDGVAQGFFAAQGGVLGDLAVQPDGKLLIAGGAPIGTDPATTGFAIGRANPDGSPDQTFGDGGTVRIRPPAAADSPLHLGVDGIAVQPDGRIVAAGNQSRAGAPMQVLSGWALARFLPDGRLDPGFGVGGWSATALALGERTWPSGLVGTGDGKVVVGGEAYECGSRAVSLVRFHADDSGSGDSAGGPVVRTCDPVVDMERDGDLPLAVECPFVEDVCRGTAAVEVGAARAGKRYFKLSGGRAGTVTIRPSRAGRRLLARRRSVRGTVRYTVKDGDGNRRVTSRRIRIRR